MTRTPLADDAVTGLNATSSFHGFIDRDLGALGGRGSVKASTFEVAW